MTLRDARFVEDANNEVPEPLRATFEKPPVKLGGIKV
jgi:hypothetical protein